MKKLGIGVLVVVAVTYIVTAIAAGSRTNIAGDGKIPASSVMSLLMGYHVDIVCKEDETTCKNPTAELKTYFLPSPLFCPMTTWAVQSPEVKAWLVAYGRNLNYADYVGMTVAMLIIALCIPPLGGSKTKPTAIRRQSSPCPGNCGCDGNCGDRCKCK